MVPIRGKVVTGKRQARGVGYPTANLEYAYDEAPESGVWTCRVEHEGKLKEGLAVIGMWKLENELPSLEVHLLDFAGDLYDQPLAVALMTKLRDLEKFDSIDELVAQIEKDVEAARAEFESLK